MWKKEKVIELINAYIEQDIFPGTNFAVLEDQKMSEYVLGNATLIPEKTPLASGKMWDLASVTKVVGTGTVLINLVFAGKIDLDEKLKTYLPEFSNETLTIRHLLTHTSGIDPYIKDRNELGPEALKKAILNIQVTDDKTFKYTDINFILLGFMLEEFFGLELDEIFQSEVFDPWEMKKTTFGPVENAVATSPNIPVGTVHDPKARVLGTHCGSAGLFSDLASLEKFVQTYFSDESYLQLVRDYSNGSKKRSLAWDILEKNENWILHTGYTGTFILMNLKEKKAVIFLSNRVHIKDERAQWIKDRDRLIEEFIAGF